MSPGGGSRSNFAMYDSFADDDIEEGPGFTKRQLQGKCIFITGGSGFVGKALTEKLLRSVPDVTIILLIRPKRGKAAQERLEEILNDKVFERVRMEKGESVFSHVSAVEGNIEDVDKLGIDPDEYSKMCAKVQIVIHSAATLDFAITLRDATSTNLIGTKNVLKFGQQCPKLVALVHVSSAYVNSNLNAAEERLYEVPADSNRLIDLCSSSTDEELELILPEILNTHLNTYTFTKALAEHEVNNSVIKQKGKAVIIRPSMITCAWKEPIPGWTNSKNGPSGFLMGASKGVVRRLPVNKNFIYDYVPIDIVVNMILVSAAMISANKITTEEDEVPIFHGTSSVSNPFRWTTVEKKINTYLHKEPLKSAVWYPYLKLVPTLRHFSLSAWIVHMIPAYFLDLFLKMTGAKPRLVRLHTNVNKSLKLLEPFIFTEWLFHNDKAIGLSERLDAADKKEFPIDFRTLDWPNYFSTMVTGVRRYLNNEEPSTLKAAIFKDNILFSLNLCLQIFLILAMWAISTLFFSDSWFNVVLPLLGYALFCML
uniref:Fatty acyl-CoA reductase n=1 Tax=Timema shepardi TaxID=629360 RepID=A0A7R9G5G8_TIMSH|nr:unnamed protein product [Timema shepardi]